MRRAATLALGLLVVAGCGGSDQQAGDRASRDARAELSVPSVNWRTDFSRHTVPLDEFQAGGPGKDGIPAIDRPRFASARETTYLRPREPVLELVIGTEARAYPLQILIWHEIVNDRLAGVPVAVTFCPLCNTAVVFDRRVAGKTLAFGTTGNLRNSDLVMYDRETESWWQQFSGEAIVGELAGRRLERLPARIVAWDEFRRTRPGGLVLTRETGHQRPYGRNPYAGYDEVGSSPIFGSANLDDDRLPPKERVVFIERGSDALAIPLSTLARRKVMTVTVGGARLVVRYRAGVASALDSEQIPEGRDVGSAVVLEHGRPVAFDQPFWFAVAAFRPDVRVIR